MDKAQIIKNSGLAENLTDDEIGLLANISVAESYSCDDVIIREDDTSKDVFIIFSGWVHIEAQRFTVSSDKIKIEALRMNGVVGEVAFIDGSRRTASAVAKDDVDCLRFPCEKLESLMDTHHRIGLVLMRNIAILVCARMRNLTFELRNHLLW